MPIRTFVGEYLPGQDSYSYYPTNETDRKNIVGTVRSNIRIEVRTSGSHLFVAETYTRRGDKEVMIQSYRFVKE